MDSESLKKEQAERKRIVIDIEAAMVVVVTIALFISCPVCKSFSF
jgi:hypothetical protein